MNTVTHVLVNAAIDRRVRERGVDAQGDGHGTDGTVAPAPEDHPIHTKAFLWGGAAPDLPLIVMTVVAAAWFMVGRGWGLGESLSHVFRDLYFSNPFWKAANNVLQAPAMLLLWLGVVLLIRRRWPSPGRALLWFLAGMVIHVALDIPVHHDDGPLLLFPFEWTVRFHSPISYWDPRHHGDVVGIVEYASTAALVLYLLRYRLSRWWGGLRA